MQGTKSVLVANIDLQAAEMGKLKAEKGCLEDVISEQDLTNESSRKRFSGANICTGLDLRMPVSTKSRCKRFMYVMAMTQQSCVPLMLSRSNDRIAGLRRLPAKLWLFRLVLLFLHFPVTLLRGLKSSTSRVPSLMQTFSWSWFRKSSATISGLKCFLPKSIKLHVYMRLCWAGIFVRNCISALLKNLADKRVRKEICSFWL